MIWEIGFIEFFFVTVVIAGGAAWMTGRAIANNWLGNGVLVFYMVLLAAATRFIHFSLFDGTLLSLKYYVVDLIVLLIMAFAGRAVTRSRQMQTQYAFLKR